MSPDEIVKIEAELKNIGEVEIKKNLEELVKDGIVEYFDGDAYYINYLKEKIDIYYLLKEIHIFLSCPLQSFPKSQSSV